MWFRRWRSCSTSFEAFRASRKTCARGPPFGGKRRSARDQAQHAAGVELGLAPQRELEERNLDDRRRKPRPFADRIRRGVPDGERLSHTRQLGRRSQALSLSEMKLPSSRAFRLLLGFLFGGSLM